MCLTILYGAYELLGNQGSKTKKSTKNQNPVKELKDFATSVTKKLVDEKLSKEYGYLIEQAANEWHKDPFIHSATPLKKQLTTPSVPQKAVNRSQAHRFLYTGYLKLGTTKIAVINGMEYAEGESLNTKGLFVKSISPHNVVIAKVNGRETIQLPLIESGPTIGN